jgi:cell division protein FtsL
MSRLDVFLVALVVVSSLALVQSQHRARIQFAQLERLKTEARGFDELHRGLAIEQSSLADPARVDQVARLQLGLVPPASERSLALEAAHSHPGGVQ